MELGFGVEFFYFFVWDGGGVFFDEVYFVGGDVVEVVFVGLGGGGGGEGVGLWWYLRG